MLGPWASVLRPFQAKLLIPTETAELRVPRHVSKQHLKPLPAQMTTRAGPGQTLPKHLMSPDSSEHLLRGLVKTLDLTVPGANEMFFSFDYGTMECRRLSAGCEDLLLNPGQLPLSAIQHHCTKCFLP